MEEPNTIIEVPQPIGLVADIKSNCSVMSSCCCGKEHSDVTMPICFLVKEQAKSVVAIQELQKRMDSVETIQDDVIDAIIEVRGYLSCSQRNASSINLDIPTKVTSNSFSTNAKSNLLKSRRFSYSLSPFREVPLTVPRRRSLSLRDSLRECKKEMPNISSGQEASHKLFDLAKTKESALESDKQDSGLDSDCRDPNDPQASLNKHSHNWPRRDSGDELLHLLDEIGQKSEILQRQVSSVDENITLNDLKEEMSQLQTDRQGLHQHLRDVKDERDLLKSKLNHLETASSELVCKKKDLQKQLLSTLVEDHDFEDGMGNVMQSVYENPNFNVGTLELFENKRVSGNALKLRKTAANKIDSAMVSAVLKETNAVELQRQVLIYLVENAVLHTKLGEMEHSLISKQSESEKFENGLKDEIRILMMENRELRISLDEQKLEMNALKSKMVMMERMFQSVTVENRELSCQLGESFGLQSVKTAGKHNLSSSFTFGTAENARGRRSSLPPQFCYSQDRNVNCNKTKLLPNTSSFLDVTIEEQEEYPMEATGFNQHVMPLGASTPAFSMRKPKDLKFSTLVNASPVVANSNSPNLSHYYAIRKRLKSGDKDHDKTNKKEHYAPERCHNNEPECNHSAANVIRSAKHPMSSERKLPLESGNKFPFSTILEKLKANSEYKVSKNTSIDQKCDTSEISNSQKSLSSSSRLKSVVTHDKELATQHSSDSSHENCSHNKKTLGNTRNLHQRIQDILDRITAEETGT